MDSLKKTGHSLNGFAPFFNFHYFCKTFLKYLSNVSFRKEHRQETIIYLALWALLFLAPVMSLAIRTSNSDISFDWSEILTVWKEFALFFVAFLIHNHLLAPMLVYKQKRLQYFGLVIAIVAIFQLYQCNHRPAFREHKPPHERFSPVGDEELPPLPPDLPKGDFEVHEPHVDHEHPVAPFRPDGPRPDFNKRAPLFIGQHDIVSIIILILMFGMNLGVKLYFRQRSDQKRLSLLEKENLEQQLEYLKYQINPHFLMNTLNNIHALVDIDPEKAKSTILELSKMMRFVLYEGNKQGVPLDREMAFLQNYITLMKLRYTDKVRITVDIPQSLPNKEVPPLMFITFVENAFKHGVSYRHDSFIDIKVMIDGDRLIFLCRNSRIPQEEDKHGGVGLTNVKQRLDLIYKDTYTLDIKDEAEQYSVTLNIPL